MNYFTHKKRVGIITWHYYPNFGSALQTYALFTTLKALGTKPLIINYKNPKYNIDSFFKTLIKRIIGSTIGVFNKHRKYSFIRFWQKIKYTKKVYTNSTIDTDKFDCVVCGSDQIWAPNVFNPVYFLSFVKNNSIKKISYAPSIGLNDIPDSLVDCYSNLLKDFSDISIREETGKELLRQKCNINKITTVLDPTFLLDVDEYRKIEKKVNIKNRFIFCYFLNQNHNYYETVINYAVRNNLMVVGCSANKDDSKWLGDYGWIGPQEFLWLIDHAECIFTDSYHGCIFSLLFHKKLLVLKRFNDFDPISQNSRIIQLDKWFDLSNNFIEQFETSKEVRHNDIAYFEKKLIDARKISFDFLEKALK